MYAFLDADVTVEPEHLVRGVAILEERNDDYLACNVRLYAPEERTLAEAYDCRFGVPIKRYFEKWNYGPTCGLFVRTPVFKAVGLFDERLISGGDTEFSDHVHRAGRPQAFTDDLIVYPPVRSLVRALIEKNVRIRRGTYQRCHYHPNRYGSPLSAPLPNGTPPTTPVDGRRALSRLERTHVEHAYCVLPPGLHVEDRDDGRAGHGGDRDPMVTPRLVPIDHTAGDDDGLIGPFIVGYATSSPFASVQDRGSFRAVGDRYRYEYRIGLDLRCRIYNGLEIS